MPVPRYPRAGEPLPEPLPPGERTVGQLVAETIRFYQGAFWSSLPLGLPVALLNQISFGQPAIVQALLLALAAPLMAASYARAAVLVLRARTTPTSRLVLAVAVGSVVFFPAAFLSLLFVLPALAWLALLGLVVPVLVVEPLGVPAALRRAIALARADYLHALGSIATLVILFYVSKLALVVLLQGSGDQTIRAAVFLADVVLSPLLFLGSALLYTDQAARLIDSGSPKRPRRRRRDADLHPADDAHRAGGADAQVESRPAPRGQR